MIWHYSKAVKAWINSLSDFRENWIVLLIYLNPLAFLKPLISVCIREFHMAMAMTKRRLYEWLLPTVPYPLHHRPLRIKTNKDNLWTDCRPQVVRMKKISLIRHR